MCIDVRYTNMVKEEDGLPLIRALLADPRPYRESHDLAQELLTMCEATEQCEHEDNSHTDDS